MNALTVERHNGMPRGASMVKPIVIVQGGQYGSEAKGAIAAFLCQQRDIDFAVRTGATNAGHTVVYNGTTVKLQQLPVGFVHPSTRLVLGAGTLIDPEILAREVALLSQLTGEDIRDRLSIDRRCGLHLPDAAVRSAASGRHHAIGATGKGCSEALIDRIRNRGTPDARLFGESPYADGYDVCDTESLLNNAWDGGAAILLEGTQGQLLDLYLGPYPYTTHKQTGPAQWMLESGLSPSLPTETVLVVRTFPIRVAGNSGPLPDEISWPMLAREINGKRTAIGLEPVVREDSIEAFEEALRVTAAEFDLPPDININQHEWPNRTTRAAALSEWNTAAWKLLPPEVADDLARLFEMTTVTKKLRRIARLNLEALEVSARQARPNWIALTFANYIDPEDWYEKPSFPGHGVSALGTMVEKACHAPVNMLSYGPGPEHILVR